MENLKHKKQKQWSMKRIKTSTAVAKKTKVMPRKKPSIPRIVDQGKQGFAHQMKAQLKFCSQQSITLTSGIWSSYKYRANSLYDPDFPGIGHQPLYFDQYMAVYNHFCVTQSRIVVVPFIDQARSINPMVTLFLDDDTNPSVVTEYAAIEREGCVFTHAATSSTSYNIPNLTLTYKASTVYAGDPLSRDELQGTASSGPTEEQIFTIGAADLGAPATSVISFLAIIYYDVTFYELKSIAQS